MSQLATYTLQITKKDAELRYYMVPTQRSIQQLIVRVKVRLIMMNRMTTLGLDVRVERVLAYAFGWLSGIILFFLEKNRNVRWHAAQSMVTFGSLSILMLAVSMLKNFMAWIPILGWLRTAVLGLLLTAQ